MIFEVAGLTPITLKDVPVGMNFWFKEEVGQAEENSCIRVPDGYVDMWGSGQYTDLTIAPNLANMMVGIKS